MPASPALAAMGQAAAALARERFDVRVCAQRLSTTYYELAGISSAGDE